jgi:hypothetical protein
MRSSLYVSCEFSVLFELLKSIDISFVIFHPYCPAREMTDETEVLVFFVFSEGKSCDYISYPGIPPLSTTT